MNTTITAAAVHSARAPEAVHLQPVVAVCFGAQAEPLAPLDHERELLIKIEGLQLELQMSIWTRTGDFGAHGAATRHQARMVELIKGRSPAVVARMEAERGLVHA
ncbi:hypothetical protein LJR074_002161 [Acidovorax sp. LjRoot74]|uniref:hypothetical protein n=1 Tax=Acidovorax sp. LjRoot74 TaxID=3342337 RepID=UPI003ED13181